MSEHADTPEQPTPETRVANARAMGKVVRTIETDGVVADHLHVGHVLPMRWVRATDDTEEAHIHHRDDVRAAIRDAEATYTLPKERSLFREGDGS